MGAIRAYWLAVLATAMALSVVAGAFSAKPQNPAASSAAGATALVVKGAVKQEVRVTLGDLKTMPRAKRSAKGHDGALHEYEGVLLKTLLAKAGVPLAADLRGQNMALYVVAEAGDHYRAVFSVAELDDDFAAEAALVADTADGQELDTEQGPLRLVVPGDKRQGRWVRMLKFITIAKATA